MNGYMGKVLFVDLTSGTTREQPIPDDVYQSLLSGVEHLGSACGRLGEPYGVDLMSARRITTKKDPVPTRNREPASRGGGNSR